MRAFQICNGLGAGNIGDDLMARAFWNHLPSDLALDVAVFPESARLRERYPLAHSYLAVDWHGNECQGTPDMPGLLVGDTPVTDSEGIDWPLRFLARRLQHFHDLGQPVDAVGVGVDGNLGPDARRLFRDHFLPVRSWTVRSQSCKDSLVALGVAESQIRVGADWGWLYESPYDLGAWACAFWRKLGIDPKRPLLVANVVNMQWRDREDAKRALASALDWAAERLGMQIAFFCNECRSGTFFDFAAAHQVAALMKRPAVVVPNEYYAPSEAIALLACATVTLGARYHFVVESVLAGSVAIAALRGEKMRGLASELSIPVAGMMNSLDKDEMTVAILHAAEQRAAIAGRLAERRLELAGRALENMAFLRVSSPYDQGQWADMPSHRELESPGWADGDESYRFAGNMSSTSGSVDSLESLTTSILRAKRHEGGLKMWPCLRVQPEWFSAIQEEVRRLRERRSPSDSTRPDHPSNWAGLVGRAAQHSLFNSSGDTADYASDFNSESRGKRFTDSSSPAIERLVSGFAERLHNFRINTYFPHSGVKPHEEPIVKDNLVCLRFHLPIFTNDKATLILDGERFHFEAGIIYYFNKGCVHAAENLGEEPRCHFLFDLWLDEWVFQNVFAAESGMTPDPGLHRITAAERERLCASTAAEFTEYMQGTASGSILRAERRPGGEFMKSPVNFDPDIVPTDESIALSDDWHPLEHWEGDTFRWVSGSAGLTLLALEDGMEPIVIDLEPGPGVEKLPAEVEIVDSDGCQLLTADVSGRETLRLSVPVHAGTVNRVRIVVRNGGRKVEGDPRVLDFRVFRIDRAQRAFAAAQ